MCAELLTRFLAQHRTAPRRCTPEPIEANASLLAYWKRWGPTEVAFFPLFFSFLFTEHIKKEEANKLGQFSHRETKHFANVIRSRNENSQTKLARRTKTRKRKWNFADETNAPSFLAMQQVLPSIVQRTHNVSVSPGSISEERKYFSARSWRIKIWAYPWTSSRCARIPLEAINARRRVPVTRHVSALQRQVL